MSEPIVREVSHTKKESGNEYTCQKIVRGWIDTPGWPTSQVIKQLHVSLMHGVESYKEKGLVPTSPGQYRNTDVRSEGHPSNFYVSGTDLHPTMQKYTDTLDKTLENLPNSAAGNVEKIVYSAAWAYYSFSRIHPFLDGNGRLGRMVLKRVLSGAGMKDLIFHARSLRNQSRDRHLHAMNGVDKTGNLVHLEMYLLDQLELRYADDVANTTLYAEITETMNKKQREITTQSNHDLTNVWEGFSGLSLDGVADTTGEY